MGPLGTLGAPRPLGTLGPLGLFVGLRTEAPSCARFEVLFVFPFWRSEEEFAAVGDGVVAVVADVAAVAAASLLRALRDAVPLLFVRLKPDPVVVAGCRFDLASAAAARGFDNLSLFVLLVVLLVGRLLLVDL